MAAEESERMREVTGHDEVLKAFYADLQALHFPIGSLELPPKAARELQMRWLGYISKEVLRAEFTVPERYANPAGVVQGGFLCAVFDNVMGPLSLVASGGITTTIDLATTFLRPARPGETITFEARVKRTGRTLVHIIADATNGKGELVATAVSNILVVASPGQAKRA
jgi:uncharacterized protein (TIGR00369 family)